MTEEAKRAMRDYYREWRKKNPDKVREKNRRYWEKRAAEAAERRDQDAKTAAIE